MQNKENNYFDYLCSIVGKAEMYSKLLSALHNMEYYPLIPNDDNRCEDGKQLRLNFINEEGPQALSQCHNGECTVLEMLIGLSYRLEFETMSSQWEKHPDEWFWIMIDNLVLTGYTNQTFTEVGDCYVRDDVTAVVSKFLDRKYSRNGYGGLFPLKNPQKDQRRVEIWYQMSAYIMENYPM